MRLLVSVTNANEARVAVEGGVDIVDVKNPAEGSLGAPRPGVIERVREVVPPERPVSAAIGDLPNLPGTAALAALGAARSGAAYVKVGLWGTSTTDEAAAVLRAVRDALDGGAAGAGQSSWGPAVYGIVADEQVGRELARRMDAELAGGARVELVRFDNGGARLEPG